jgi:uncharacterized repeat protein (TIGR03806 family)
MRAGKKLFACAAFIIAAAGGVSADVLHLSKTAKGTFPPLLSQTGAFPDIRQLTTASELIPYDLNVAFWSDGAVKRRWMLPSANASNKIGFSPTGEWTFPKGTVFVKHFDLATDETNPQMRRRLETRFLVCGETGGVYGVTYKWREDNSDADLLNTNLLQEVAIRTTFGIRTQQWYYPSREDCVICHTPLAGGVLGVNARQMNRDFSYPDGKIANQLLHWKQVGLFANAPSDESLVKSPKLARLDDQKSLLEDRARSWLDVNCANCHRPGGTVAGFDARYDTPLHRQNIINGPVLIDRGIDNARVVAPNDIWRSTAFQRIKTVDEIKMPPVGHQVVDEQGVKLMRAWIESLAGLPVLEPPVVSPQGGEFSSATTVTLLHRDPLAKLHYTLDGSAPGKTSAVYTGPLQLTGPATVRARAYRDGFTRSIIAQQTFIVKE